MVPDQTLLRSKTFLFRPNGTRTVYDQTQVRSNALPIRPNYARSQTQVRSNALPIRPNYARSQTQVRSNTPMIRLFRPNWPLTRPTPDHGPDCSRPELPSRPCNFGLESTGVRSVGSDYKAFGSAPHPGYFRNTRVVIQVLFVPKLI